MIKLSDKEKSLLRLIQDPVLWVEASLRNPEPGHNDEPIKLRPYQRTILQSKSKRKVCRMGRRTGKCVSKDALIITDQGRIRAEDLFNMEDKPAILTFDEDDFKIKNTDQYAIWPNGIEPVYRITTKLGRQTKVTLNHPFCVLNEDGFPDWLELDSLEIGDRIAVPSTYNNLIPGQPVSRDISRLLGYLVGDGGTSSGAITFTNIDPSILEDISLILGNYDCQLKKRGSKPADYSITGIVPFKKYGSHIINLCKETDLYGKLATNKRVPELIMSADQTSIAEFIGAYWDCDGWVSAAVNGNIEVGASTASEGLAHDLQHLLLRLGINASLRFKAVKYKEGLNSNWTISVSNRVDMIRFLDIIPMVLKGARKNELLEILKPRKNTNNGVQNTVPEEIINYIDSIKTGWTDNAIKVQLGTKVRRGYDPSKDTLVKYARLFDDEYLGKLCYSDIIWDEITSIEYVDEEETYDLSVTGTQTLISDDIISHNTSSMVMHIIWYAFTHRDSKQVIATPYQSQIDVIFDMIRQYIKAAPGLQSSVDRDIKQPAKIVLTNGSIIHGFTAGTKSGDSGASMRGQAADWIYLDELDYMRDTDVETISAIALDNVSIGIWGSSTPTGRRGMFWKMCTGVIKKKIRDENHKVIAEESVWTEFYHPSTENPNWNEDMEDEFRAMFSEVAYEHEVLAEFGEETVGVFKKDLIDKARKKYTYDEVKVLKKIGPRIMGVDWDKYADASQAVVLEYDKTLGQFFVLYRHETAKSEFTLTNAVNRIIELNEDLDLDYIFVDRGYGEYQVETLHMYGQANPKSGLQYKVRGVMFGETKDIIDPHSKAIHSVPLKPFMVNSLVVLFEGARIRISDSDEMIIRQLENYQVVKRTISGSPVYTSSDEHALDCLMLCCLGYIEKFPEIVNEIFINKFATSIGKINTKEDAVKTVGDELAEEILKTMKPTQTFVSVQKFNTRGVPKYRRTSF